ncbi:MAG: hypothetical protein QOD16_11060 [Nitrososphaeraceae archaeon]|nr:hypothetical protein [Nitrososphaeraceae archaeon]
MNKNRFTVSTTAGIAVVLLLMGGTGTNNILFNTGYAQVATLGEPIFVEKGGDTIKREIGPNTTQYTFTSNGTLNGNIEYHKTGEFVSVSKGNNVTFDQGKGVITTKDGSETANYTFIEVSNGTAYQGASAYSTNSTGKLSSLNNILVIFKGPTESGNYALEQWHWK